MTPTFREMIFHPWRMNVLDYVDAPGLVTIDGQSVQIKRAGRGFAIWIGAKLTECPDNNSASYALNAAQVGVKV